LSGAFIEGFATCHFILPEAGSSAAHDPTVVFLPALGPDPPSVYDRPRIGVDGPVGAGLLPGANEILDGVTDLHRK
jgi:hypothetical protein